MFQMESCANTAKQQNLCSKLKATNQIQFCFQLYVQLFLSFSNESAWQWLRQVAEGLTTLV